MSVCTLFVRTKKRTHVFCIHFMILLTDGKTGKIDPTWPQENMFKMSWRQRVNAGGFSSLYGLF
jgi:hypothetical protein